MSYNIDNWKTKKIENFTIPLETFETCISESLKQRGWGLNKPELILVNNHLAGAKVIITGGAEGFKLEGYLSSNYTTMHVEKMTLSGEGSGTFYFEILPEILKQSKGIVEALVVWEGGDEVIRLFIEDGAQREEEL